MFGCCQRQAEDVEASKSRRGLLPGQAHDLRRRNFPASRHASRRAGIAPWVTDCHMASLFGKLVITSREYAAAAAPASRPPRASADMPPRPGQARIAGISCFCRAMMTPALDYCCATARQRVICLLAERQRALFTPSRGSDELSFVECSHGRVYQPRLNSRDFASTPAGSLRFCRPRPLLIKDKEAFVDFGDADGPGRFAGHRLHWGQKRARHFMPRLAARARGLIRYRPRQATARFGDSCRGLGCRRLARR